MSVAAFAAAPTASATAKNASSVTTITWWASPISTSGPDLRKVLIADFEKAYPNIKVNLQTAPTDTDTNRADLVTTISGGANTPDVFMGDVIWPGQFGPTLWPFRSPRSCPRASSLASPPAWWLVPPTTGRFTGRPSSRTRASSTTAPTC